MKKIAFQGTRGAYSEQALNNYFGTKVESVGFDLSEQVCENLANKQIDAAILPVENSIIGNIDINIDLIYKHQLYAIAEYYLKINHCLLTRPSVEIDDIEFIHSHPAAISQCRDFINQHNIQSIPDFDTAGACLRLIKKESTNHGVIASELCSKYYDLKIIKKNIQKVDNNFTRFLVVVHQDNIPSDIKEEKTSLAFTTKNSPGALLRCLQKFSTHNINLTKIESQPIPENPFIYTFFIDCETPFHHQNMKTCIAELEQDAQLIKVMGSYPIDKFTFD